MNIVQESDIDPYRWVRYNEMISQREVIDFNRIGFCKKCGKRKGDHATDSILSKNPHACKFYE
jgi:hypothetical protein